MHVVAAQNVEPDGAQSFPVEQNVDRAPEIDPVQTHRPCQQPVPRQLGHVVAILPGR